MKRKQFVYVAISGLVLLSVILKSCNKPKPNPDYLSSTDYDPRVSISVSFISTNSAVLEGKITNTAYSTIQECIIHWSTQENLIWVDNRINNVKLDFFNFKDTLTGLVPNTIYYVVAALKYTHTGSSIIGGDNSVAIHFATLP